MTSSTILTLINFRDNTAYDYIDINGKNSIFRGVGKEGVHTELKNIDIEIKEDYMYFSVWGKNFSIKFEIEEGKYVMCYKDWFLISPKRYHFEVDPLHYFYSGVEKKDGYFYLYDRSNFKKELNENDI